MTGWALAINADPADGTGDPAYSAETWRNIMAVLQAVDQGNALEGRQGLRPRGTTVGNVVTLSGSTITAHVHTGVVTTDMSATTGSYMVALVASENHALTAADGSNDRIDRVVGRVYDDDEDSSGQREYTTEYLVGTPGPSPSAPATPAGAISLATIAVPQSGTGSAAVTVDHSFTAANGGILVVRTDKATATDWPADPYVGQYVFSLIDGLHYWDGTDWIGTGAPTIFVFTGNGTWTKPDGLKAARVRVQGGGGAGGAAGGGAGQAEGAAGGGGGYVEALLQADEVAATEAVTVGTGGAGDSGGGDDGTDSVFDTIAGELRGSGGIGGGGGSNTTGNAVSSGGDGGAAAGGDINLPGGEGGHGRVISGQAVLASIGGSSGLSGGGVTPPTVQGTGATGRNYGGGGSGAFAGGTGQNGGSGANGRVIVEHYF